MLEPIPPATRDNPARFAAWVDTQTTEQLVGYAEAGLLSPDAIDPVLPDGRTGLPSPRKLAVLRALQERHQARCFAAAAEAWPEDLAIVNLVVGHDDVDAAIDDLTLTQHETLGGERPEYEVHGDVLYVRGVAQAAVAGALIQTRGGPRV
jgi:hypothetical protein